MIRYSYNPIVGEEGPAMNKWLRKSLVILFSIATFGLVTPPASLAAVQDKPTEDTVTKSTLSDGDSSPEIIPSDIEVKQDVPYSKDQILHQILLEAEEKSYTKFGNKIGDVIEEDFKNLIFPKMEEVITYYVQDDELFEHVEISKPSGGTGEKIFHIYNAETGQDVLRFHVRRENRPLEGYWFNFHYHTYHDSFQSHKDLGSIYWDKNTPPNWMSFH